MKSSQYKPKCLKSTNLVDVTYIKYLRQKDVRNRSSKTPCIRNGQRVAFPASSISHSFSHNITYNKDAFLRANTKASTISCCVLYYSHVRSY
jgi:hypothetical protein